MSGSTTSTPPITSKSSALVFATPRTGTEKWALDRTHDVFVRLAERADSVRQKDDPGGWLYRTACRVCFRTLDRRRTFERVLEGLSSVRKSAIQEQRTPAPEASAKRGELVRDLNTLPANERSVIVMLYVDGLKQAEVVSVLGYSKGYVSKLHQRGLERLRALGWEVDDDD